MGKTKNTIKINGHLYDASSGERISGAHSNSSAKNSRSVDGVISQPHIPANHPRPESKITKVEVKAQIHKPAIKKSAHHRAPAAQRNVQHSHTLMRSAVKKPEKHSKPAIKVHSEVNKSSKNTHILVNAKHSANKLDEKRLSYAKHVQKSPTISRFAKQPVEQSSSAFATPAKTHAHHKVAAEAKPSPHHDIFEHAIKHATAHEQKPHKKPASRKRRISAYSALAVISVVLIGVVVSQSMTGLRLQMASAKAGFDASLPDYKPAGYHLGQLNSSAGVVAANYSSNSDQDRKFSITQKNSSWDSNTLRDMFVEGNDKNYRVAETNGLSIFIYGDNNATWVNNGVWYVVHGNGSLSDNQLVDIAKSM